MIALSNMLLPDNLNCTVAVVGLGYVGLPLAVEIARKKQCSQTNDKISRKVIGFDLNELRINQLKNGIDKTNEISVDDLSQLREIDLTCDPQRLKDADVFIVTVPTPIDNFNKPNLKPLKEASIEIGKNLKERLNFLKENNNEITSPIIIFESTVYPGATEEVCIPLIEKYSSLKCNSLVTEESFSVGYSPERINPGDKSHRLTDIVKVTSGSNVNAAKWINNFYSSFITVGTFLAQSIKVAEAAKIIENTQRDINIALINELSIIFRKMNIDIFDVLKAAGTKWNFLPFKPGLVGGHCIGVDPYYLTYKSEEIGYYPQIVLSGRRINDSRASWIADQIILEMARKEIPLLDARILILGCTFKANCPDTRNSKVFDLLNNLRNYGIKVQLIDPLANNEEVKISYKVNIFSELENKNKFAVVIAAVDHEKFLNYNVNDWLSFVDKKHLFIDLKDIIPRSLNPIRF